MQKIDVNSFVPFDAALKGVLKDYLRGSDYTGSDYSYHAFISWFDKGEYLAAGDVLYLRAYVDDGVYYWPPLIKKDAPLTLREVASALPDDACFAFCTDEFVAATYGGYYVYTHRDWAEYVYKATDFIAMQGKRYHAKRNHIAKFKKSYNSSMSRLTADDIDDVREFERAWLAAREFEGGAESSAETESKIVKSWIKAALDGELVCDVLRVDGKMAGIAIGEINGSTAIEMYEKGDVTYEGVYSYLAHEFAARNFSECEYINRQEDMGLEGLRKSKLSYYPEFLLDKYVLKPAAHVADCYAERTGRLFSKDVKKVKLPEDKYSVRRLEEEDFDETYAFLETERDGLKNKLFFLNYTPDELRGVLKDGFMLGAFCDGRLIATCAYDTDAEYGAKLAEICGDAGGRYFEFGGIMTARAYRGMGVSSRLCREVIEEARKNLSPATLCAVVQFDNAPSLDNLKKLGFEARATLPQGEYTFTYLTLSV